MKKIHALTGRKIRPEEHHDGAAAPTGPVPRGQNAAERSVMQCKQVDPSRACSEPSVPCTRVAHASLIGAAPCPARPQPYRRRSQNRLVGTQTQVLHPGFTIPTDPVKPSPSGSSLPDRFDRKPVETDQIQIQIQNRMCKRFRPVYRPV